MLPQEDLSENRPAIDLQVVREPSLAGRRLFLDARRFLRICHLIEKGAPATSACRTELVSYQFFRKRVTQYPKYQRRLKQAEEVREPFFERVSYCQSYATCHKECGCVYVLARNRLSGIGRCGARGARNFGISI
jgi:hypothetical protein